MGFKENIEAGLKKALKEHDAVRVSTLRMLLGAMKYREVEKVRPLTDEEFYGVVKTLIKQHSESIESFKKGNRQDLVEKEEKELLVLQEFVPAQMTAAELSGEVDEAIRQLEAKTPKDMGKVMKFLMEKHSSRIDGKVLSEMVRQRLAVQN
ncbi:MAG TPA: GatB/YqeY domain-containing protein [Syntrophorhabdales bacterium]|nr:GatB/YqeY domain-containing protein [Syntrophorhabdales bacterium]